MIDKELYPDSDEAKNFGKYLSQIYSPEDLRKFSVEELPFVVKECREFIIDIVSKYGGHFGASLGVAELTVALHYVYNTPYDQLVWDVGHQAYIHKILTERKKIFYSNRQYKGISGFPKRSESEYDTFGVGHSSTSIAAALGMAVARTRKNEHRKIAAIIGDGSLTGGIAFESLNHLGHLKEDVTVILNDNRMSIDPNVGGLKDYLAKLTTNIAVDSTYNKMRDTVWNKLGGMKSFGEFSRRLLSKMELSTKSFFTPGGFFEAMGIRYFGPINGHDVELLAKVLKEMRKLDGPKILHILTVKGKGFQLAEKDQLTWHAQSGAFDKITGKSLVEKKQGPPTYQSVFGKTITELAKKDSRIMGITAAMPSGTSLSILEKELPNQFFDTGIAEQHAVTFAGGLATQGMKPVVGIYSTFLQRAYDQIIHDIAIQNLNVVFVLDRSGLVGADGATHHGVFDLSYLRCIPNMVIMAPRNEHELRNMLHTAIEYNDGPIALRYPRGEGTGIALKEEFESYPIGKAEIMQEGERIAILSIGVMATLAMEVAENIKKETSTTPMVVNMRFVKPLDELLLLSLENKFDKIVTLEENAVLGGFGSAVNEFYSTKNMKVLNIGIPDEFIEHGTVSELHKEIGLDKKSVMKRVVEFMNGRFAT